MYPHFFDPQALGASLKEVATDVIKSGDSELISRWFHSEKDADFFVWMDTHRNIIKQQLTFYGQVVEWNIVEGLKTGLIIEEEGRGAGQKTIKGSDLIQFDDRLQKAPVEQALSLLKHMTSLNEVDRQAMVGHFSMAKSSLPLDPEEFVRRFGQIHRPAAHASKSWLHRLIGWFLRPKR